MKYLLLFILLPVYLAGAIQCLFQPSARLRWRTYFSQQGIAWDQMLNASIPPFFTLSYADETMSARIWRAEKRGKIVGTFMRPIIDWLFRWQGFTNHCERAYAKEIERRSLPPEYREPQPPA